MCITSSHFQRVCKATGRTDFYKLARELISQSHFHSAATDHVKYGSVAIKEIERSTELQTKDCGVCISTSHPNLCSTPDRLIDDAPSIVEIKCLLGAKDRPLPSHPSGN